MVSSLGCLIFLNFLTHSFQIWTKFDTIWILSRPNLNAFYFNVAQMKAQALRILKLFLHMRYHRWQCRETRKRTRVRALKSVWLEKRLKSKLWYYFSNLYWSTFKSISGPRGGLLNHVKKKFWKNSIILYHFQPHQHGCPLPLHDLWHFDTIALSNVWICKQFLFLRGSGCRQECLTEIWRSSESIWKYHLKLCFWIPQCFLCGRALAEACVRRRGSSRPRRSTCRVIDYTQWVLL